MPGLHKRAGAVLPAGHPGRGNKIRDQRRSGLGGLRALASQAPTLDSDLVRQNRRLSGRDGVGPDNGYLSSLDSGARMSDNAIGTLGGEMPDKQPPDFGTWAHTLDALSAVVKLFANDTLSLPADKALLDRLAQAEDAARRVCQS